MVFTKVVFFVINMVRNNQPNLPLQSEKVHALAEQIFQTSNFAAIGSSSGTTD